MRICIVSHAAYGALAGGTTGHIGGVERQTSLLAKWLAGRGHSVDMIVWSNGHNDGETVDGVRVVAACRQSDGIPGLRFFHPRWTSLLAALRRSDADVYYHNTAEYVTGQVGLWCRTFRRRFVFSAAHDADCDATLPLLTSRRERVLYRMGLRCADAVVVQTRTQQLMMRQSFGLDSEVIPMPCPEPRPEHVIEGSGPATNRILWIGRICREKRPELLLDVADRGPDLQFDFVGPSDGSSYANGIVERARRTPNVTYHGPVPRPEVPGMYKRAACLLCTSSTEGFPNTFLEAWSQGLPVVSTFDPDDLIRTRRLGWACEATPESVLAALRALVTSETSWRDAAANGRNYYLATHRPHITFGAFERVLVTGAGRQISAAPVTVPPR